MTVTLKPKTEITVPRSIRRKAGIKAGDQFEFQVKGREIRIVPKEPDDDPFSLERIDAIIEDARKNPMSPKELAAEYASLAAYGARQAKKLGIRDRDIVRIIHEFRASQRA
jgi:AbrB family looped-hinge helix DNA binding protein